MHFRRLETRVVALFIGLILAVQLAGLFFIRNAIINNAVAAVQQQLRVGERVFARLLDQKAQKIIQGARVLALDYGFREAVATQDNETIKSVLANHGDRIGASLSMLIGLDRNITASTSNALASGFQQSVLPLLVQAEQSGSAAGIVVVDRHPYQLVIIPIKAPLTISWVAMAVPVDQSVAADMHDLSALQVSIFTSDANGGWQPNVTSFAPNQVEIVRRQLPPVAAHAMLPDHEIDGEPYSARIVPLAVQGGQQTIAVLQLSLSEAMAAYTRLQRNLLLLTTLFIGAAIVISIVLTKRITGPMRALTETARRLGAGDYSASIVVVGDDEIGELAQTFNTMRDGIAQREKEIRHLAYWDALTQLPNRALFLSMLNDAIQQALSTRTRCYVLMMDLDRFKHVNDVLGHSVGDLLLQQVAARLQQELRD